MRSRGITSTSDPSQCDHRLRGREYADEFGNPRKAGEGENPRNSRRRVGERGDRVRGFLVYYDGEWEKERVGAWEGAGYDGEGGGREGGRNERSFEAGFDLLDSERV